MEKFIKDKRISNTWAIIKINDLPDNLPVLALSQFPAKSLAEFHLVKYCLVPKELQKKLNAKTKKKIEKRDINKVAQ